MYVRVYSSFHLISCGFHHSLSGLGCCSSCARCIVSNRGGIPAYSPTAKREENSAEAPPSAPANDDALLGLEQNCVREIYTHNTPEGSGAATALQNTVTPSLSI